MKNLFNVHWITNADPYKLNLDSEFDPLQGKFKNLEYKMFEFKGGEPHLQITTNAEYVGDLIITQRYNSVKDIINIILANDAARRMGFKKIHLVLPYFPAARQDRVCNVGEPLTIRVFTDMINQCGFESVTILCPHSEVTPALLNNVVVLDELEYVENIIDLHGVERHFNIICPDAGAGKRVGKIVQHLCNTFKIKQFNLVHCEKIRDVKDGSLKDFFVHDDDLCGNPTLICDDINSYGGTFIGLGKKLREKNCGKLMLFTSHADCAEGVQKIVENFDHYYTTNSKKDWDAYKYTFDGRFTCFEIKL